jgi:UDP-N-acetylmuramoyl-tripeptide--D-alanyl-D-alanine ligase
MDPTSISKIQEWVGGSFRGGGDVEVSANRVVTDSRKVGPGDFFVALRGERYDGHSFLRDVAERGAVGAMVELGRGDGVDSMRLIEVEDALAGLQRMARCYRETLPAKVVGITGSNGKTSTKEFTAAVLGTQLRVWATEGNLNNHIGVPLTLLRGSARDGAGVVEMGMNHAGEIAPLARMAVPEVGIITNIGVAHIEHLGSRQAIAEEKGALAAAISSQGTVVLNAEDEYCEFLSQMTQARVITAGIGCGEVQALDLSGTGGGTRFSLVHEGERAEVELSIPGRHMVMNATLAAAAGIALGIPLREAARGLGGLKPLHGRLEWRTVGGIRFLDDSYNANPDSMEAAVVTLAQTRLGELGRRVAVLGRMGELGGFAEEGHRRVGRAIARAGLDWLLTVGDEAAWIADEARANGMKRVDCYGSVKEAAQALKREVGSGDAVLIKGSRSAGMERVIEEVERV